MMSTKGPLIEIHAHLFASRGSEAQGFFGTSCEPGCCPAGCGPQCAARGELSEPRDSRLATRRESGSRFHLLKNMFYLYFALIVLKGIYHYWIIFPGLKQMEGRGADFSRVHRRYALRQDLLQRNKGATCSINCVALWGFLRCLF